MIPQIYIRYSINDLGIEWLVLCDSNCQSNTFFYFYGKNNIYEEQVDFNFSSSNYFLIQTFENIPAIYDLKIYRNELPFPRIIAEQQVHIVAALNHAAIISSSIIGAIILGIVGAYLFGKYDIFLIKKLYKKFDKSQLIRKCIKNKIKDDSKLDKENARLECHIEFNKGNLN